MIRARERDVAQALDAVGLAQDGVDASVEWQSVLVAFAGLVMVRTRQRDGAQAMDAVGLAQDGADASVEWQSVLVAFAGLVVVRASQRDVAQALDAVGLALDGADASVEPIVPPSAAPSRPVNSGLGDLVLIIRSRSKISVLYLCSVPMIMP